MTTVLQLNQGIMELCVTNKLPECYIKVQSGVLYLISPCGDIIARLMNLATNKINIKDIPFIFEKVKNFITTNLEELSEFFRAKKENKVTEALLKDTGLMLAEVVNPTDHKFIVTVRANSVRMLDLVHNALEDLRKLKYTQEYCIIDTNEALDYIHN